MLLSQATLSVKHDSGKEPFSIITEKIKNLKLWTINSLWIRWGCNFQLEPLDEIERVEILFGSCIWATCFCKLYYNAGNTDAHSDGAHHVDNI